MEISSCGKLLKYVKFSFHLASLCVIIVETIIIFVFLFLSGQLEGTINDLDRVKLDWVLCNVRLNWLFWRRQVLQGTVTPFKKPTLSIFHLHSVLLLVVVDTLGSNLHHLLYSHKSHSDIRVLKACAWS